MHARFLLSLLVAASAANAQSALSPSTARVAPVGYLTANPYLPGATGAQGAKYNPLSPANPYSVYGSAYSPDGSRNQYTTGGLNVVGADGQYLGKLNSNRYDPNSVSNPHGK